MFNDAPAQKINWLLGPGTADVHGQSPTKGSGEGKLLFETPGTAKTCFQC